jgi:hypothetical protein
MFTQTRSQFTQHDYHFLADVFGTPCAGDAVPGEDAASVTRMLHSRQLFDRTMTTPPLFLGISPQLFFYVFIYQALDQRRLADDDVVDYVAAVCVEFKSHEALWRMTPEENGTTVTMVDLLNLLGDVDRHQQYFLRRHIGNVSLFLTGFFPDLIFYRSRHKGAPPIAYYESIGRSQYETAAEASRTYDEDAAPVLNRLAEQFVGIRSALNLYTDAYLRLQNPKRAIERIERQAATLDEESFRQSLEL